RQRWRPGPMADRAALIGLAIGGVAAAAVAVDRLAELLIRRSERLDPEEMELPGARFWLRGTPVHYIEQGRGYPVVLVHGFGASTFSYRFLITALSERFRVIALDLPGFGYSGRDPAAGYSQTAWAELLAEFVERLGVRRAAF